MYIPMLAKSAGNKMNELLDSDKYIAEIKYDGSRYISDNGIFTSRIGKDKTDNIPHISNFLKTINAVLDGEVYYPNADSNLTTTVMGSLPKRAIELQEKQGLIRYVVFDILEYNGISLINKPLTTRQSYLAKLYNEQLYKNEYIDLSIPCVDNRKLLQEAKDNNYEGIMLKNKDALYVPSKRPEHNWYKIKRHMTDDVVIMGFTNGKGKFAGQVGSIIFGKYVNNELEEFGKCSGMTDEVREDMTLHKDKYIGRVMEIEAMEGTAKGKYRHPQFGKLRNDKLPEMCQ